MRYYSYAESEDEFQVTKYVYSEAEILDNFWEYWTREMKGNGFGHLISKESCIDDWCTIHWANREDIYKFKFGFEGKVFCINEFNINDPNFIWATITCVNDNSVIINRFVNIQEEMIKIDGITEQNYTPLW